MSNRNELIETAHGTGRLRLSDRYVPVNYVIRVYQEYVGDVPTLQSANGGLANLPAGDAAYAMIDVGKTVALELEDGRRAELMLTGLDRSFTVTGGDLLNPTA
jgi:hypothetical protein